MKIRIYPDFWPKSGIILIIAKSGFLLILAKSGFILDVAESRFIQILAKSGFSQILAKTGFYLNLAKFAHCLPISKGSGWDPNNVVAIGALSKYHRCGLPLALYQSIIGVGCPRRPSFGAYSCALSSCAP